MIVNIIYNNAQDSNTNKQRSMPIAIDQRDNGLFILSMITDLYMTFDYH